MPCSAFAQEAKQCESSTFLAHVRYASSGLLDRRNTHPFEHSGRLFAHNGVLGDPRTLENELGPYRDLVAGDTDSERFFALINRHIDAQGGNVTGGLTTAVRWAADHLPVYALNLVLVTRAELWALRYPDTHDLFVLERASGGPHRDRHLEHASSAGRIRTRSGQLAQHPAVVVASERMDESPRWSELPPGELLHVDGQLNLAQHTVVDTPPRHPLSLSELSDRAVASQTKH